MAGKMPGCLLLAVSGAPPATAGRMKKKKNAKISSLPPPGLHRRSSDLKISHRIHVFLPWMLHAATA